MSVIADFIIDLTLEMTKDKACDVIAKNKLKERLKKFLERNNTLNFNVSLDEEIDFGGLSDFIKKDLIKEVEICCLGNKNERKLARQRIIEKAVSYAAANTKLSKQRTMIIIGGTVGLISNFFRSRINRELLFVTGEIEETIQNEHDATRSLIVQGNKRLESVIGDNTLLSVDRSLDKIGSGELNEVESNLSDFMNAISVKHKLFPYFAFRMTTENKMVSIALSDEAREKYPDNFKITASSIKLGDQTFKSMGRNIFDQAYRHQLPIYLDITNAKKYLGDILDPVQTEAEEMIGTHAIMKPPAFPPAFPCRVFIDEELVVPYLLLRTKEILDDGTIIITNEEQQNYNFVVSIRIMLATNKHSFTVQPKNPTNKEGLNYRLFLKKAMTGNTVTVIASNLNERIIEANINQTDAGNLNDEIKFLQKIVAIEEYFNISISVPETISPEDQVIINRLYDLIQGGYKGSANRFDFNFKVSDELKTRVLELNESNYEIVFSTKEVFSVFNQNFDILILRKIKCVKVENLDRLKEKANILDNGDQIRIGYIPQEGNDKCEYIDIINNEDIKEGLFFANEKY